jgi:hypothetical protein
MCVNFHLQDIRELEAAGSTSGTSRQNNMGRIVGIRLEAGSSSQD